MNKMRALLVLLLCAPMLSAASGAVLFPLNLHLTREISDPLAATVITVDEYCSGNRMVSVSRGRTVIADYDKQEITEIDRIAGTYSVTRFEELATAPRGKNALAVKADVKVDPSVTLSRDALNVLIGAAFPNTSGPEHEAVLRAAATISSNTGDSTYALPVTQTFTYGDSGTEVIVRSTITRVGSEAVPAEVLMIPSAARRVESPGVTARRNQ